MRILFLFSYDVSLFSGPILYFCQNFDRYVEHLNFVGAGVFGEVWTVKINGAPRLFVQKIYAEVRSEVETDSIKAEVEALTLGCPYFPKLFYSGHNIWVSWCIIMEYIEGGTLFQYVKNEKLKDNLPAQKTIACQIAKGLEFLHIRNLTHGLVFNLFFVVL